MPFDDHSPNLAYSLVATAPSPATTGTSLIVTAGQGALFPTPPFNATVWASGAQPLTTNAEIVRVTAISTDTLTIKRAQESSSARTVIVGDQIAATVTAKTLTDVEAGFSPDLALTAMLTPRDNVIPASTSAYVISDYEIGGFYGVVPTTSGGINTPNAYATKLATLTAPIVVTAIYVAGPSGGAPFAHSGNMRAGLYADSAGAPGALLASSSPVAFDAADTLCRIPVGGPEVTGTIWLAVQSDTTFNIGASTAGPGEVIRASGVTYAGGLPNPFGSPDNTSATTTLALYAMTESVTEIGAGSVLEIG